MAESSSRGSAGRHSSGGRSPGGRSARSDHSVVLDASAILAVLHGEPGQDQIRERIRGADVRVGAVNVCEVSAKLSEAGLDKDEVREALSGVGVAGTTAGVEVTTGIGAGVGVKQQPSTSDAPPSAKRTASAA